MHTFILKRQIAKICFLLFNSAKTAKKLRIFEKNANIPQKFFFRNFDSKFGISDKKRVRKVWLGHCKSILWLTYPPVLRKIALYVSKIFLNLNISQIYRNYVTLRNETRNSPDDLKNIF